MEVSSRDSCREKDVLSDVSASETSGDFVESKRNRRWQHDERDAPSTSVDPCPQVRRIIHSERSKAWTCDIGIGELNSIE